MSVGNLFARLGGAQLKVLAHCPGERNRFVYQGVINLIASTISALGMGFLASSFFIERDGWFAVVVSVLIGVLLGTLLLLLNVVSVKTMLSVSRKRVFLRAIPRLLPGICVGIVIAFPLTVQVFRTEVDSWIVEHGELSTFGTRMRALSSIPGIKSALVMTCILVIVIEVLPTLVQTMVALSGDTLYDRVAKRLNQEDPVDLNDD